MRAEERQADVGEFRVNYGTAGTGPTVLMFHDSRHGENWTSWEPLLPLSDSHTLVMPDLLGYGKSTIPQETPDYRSQAHAARDLMEKLQVGTADLVGSGWGGQVAIELALNWPEAVRAIVLISSAYDKSQIGPLQSLKKPTLIIYAEDDMVTQLKAGYLLRDAIGTSRLEVLDPVAKDPKEDFTIAHRLRQFRAGQIVQLTKTFLASPESMISAPPEMPNELRGMALRKDTGVSGSSGTP